MLKLRITFILLCLLLAAAPVFAQDGEFTVGLGGEDNSYLVGANGMTLYIFTRDELDTSNCADQCAANWPPLTVESADALSADPAIPGELGTIERADGTLQVTYNGLPLYYWVNDEAPGDMTGQGVGGVWWIVRPATVSVWKTADLGQLLVGPTGMTVYIFTNDEPGVSNCSGQCIENWPALSVESEADLVAGNNVHGELGTIEREDGALQVTYNGWPLYYWAQDAARGDATGEGVGDVWYTLAPETVVLSSSDELGDFMVAGAGGRTLYTFDNDEAGVSNCSGDCLTNWPALTVGANDRLVAGAGIEGELGTIEREDGALQVTYNGMPLYFFAQDAAPGDTTGQARGDVWWVAAP